MENNIKVEWHEHAINFIIPSNLSLMWKVRESLLEFLASQGVEDSFEVDIVFRELLDNAIRHGNKQEAGRVVRARVERLISGVFRIEMEDQGEGFDYGSAAHPDFDEHHFRRYGYLLINTLTEQLEFNARGNAIVAHVTTYGPRNEYGFVDQHSDRKGGNTWNAR